MQQRTLKLSTLAVLIASSLGCGGGGSGSNISGIGGTGITSSGAITGFGSIFVNGVEFETDSATFRVDDSDLSESALRIGMVVTVEGTVNSDGVTGNATRVIYDGNLEGPIATAPALNADGTEVSFQLLGTTVIVSTADTVLENTTFAALSQGDLVEVSGFIDADGDLRASFLEKESGTFTANVTEVEAKGRIENLSGTSFDLNINGGATLSVDAGSASLSDIPNGTLANGQFVEVKGTLPSAGSTNLTASEVEFEDFDGDEDNVSIEGLVTNFNSLNDFLVAGTPVDASSATLEPSTLSLADGMEVEVEGSLSNGTLIATEVEIRAGDIQAAAAVSAVDSANSSVTLTLGNGTLDFRIDNQTRMEDDVLDLSPFSLAAVNPGDYLEIRAYQDGSGNLIASRLKRDDPDGDQLQGIVEAVTDAGSGNGTITILGITFNTSSATTEFEDLDDNPITPKQDFFTSGVGGSPVDDLVNITDDIAADGIADEVEFED